MRKLILLLCLSLPAFGALSYRIQWDVRGPGSDSNSGGFDPRVASPGTDYSQQNSPQITYTDLIVGPTTTHYTSALNPVSSALPGNTLRVTGGTGCTTGTFEILSNATITATVDRSLGTAASICTAVLGGSFATIAHAMAVNSGALDTIWIKTATTTLTTGLCNSTNQSSCSGTAIVSITLAGYDSTHGDITPACLAAATCTRPLITTSTSSQEIFNLYGPTNSSLFESFSLQSLELSNTASSSAYPLIAGISGGPDLFLVNVKLDVTGTNSGGASGIYNDNQFSEISLWGCECNVPSPNACIADQQEYASSDGWGTYIYYSYFHGTGTGIWDVNSGGHQRWHIIGSVFSGMSRAIYGQHTGDESMNNLLLIGNSFYNMTNEAVRYNDYADHFIYAANNIFWGGTYGMYINGYIANGPSVPFGQALSQSNAYGNQSTAAYVPYSFGAVSAGVLGGTPAGMNSSDITLTVSPFNNPSGGDFTLNNTAGGGAALKAKGFPGVSAAGTGYLDIGALQSAAAAGASIAAGGYVQ